MNRIAAATSLGMVLVLGGGAPTRPTTAVAVYDTGTASAVPLPPEAFVKREGWTEVREAAAAFRGDAVLLNSRLAVVLRQKGTGAEVYSLGQEGGTMRARLAPLGEAAAASPPAVKITQRSRSGVTLEAAFGAADARRPVLRLELRVGDVFVKTEPGTGVTALRVEAPCRFAVLPDFFADDIVIDAADLAVQQAEVPSDNFLLHLVGKGEALVMAVWNAAAEDARLTLSGREGARTIDASDIPYGKEGAIWVAVLEGPATWHTRDIAKAEAGKVIPLDWRPPYPAQWRVDWRRDDGLCDSWEMAAEMPNGQFKKHGWFGSPGTLPANRERWTTVLGKFQYPCWVDGGGQGYLQPLKSVLRFEGPALIYPINRVPETPLSAYTVVDLVRATLGVGPCEYILDVEGQHTAYKGRATCSTRDTLNPIYAKKQQKQRRAEIEKVLNEVTAFLQHIRGRIDTYVAFGHEVLAYLDREKRAHPELAQPLETLATVAKAIDARVAARQNRIKTPADHANLINGFRTDLVDYEGDDAARKCEAFTKALVEIGGNQDELVGECRWAVKVVRQRAGLAAAADPRLAAIGREIRRRSQAVLRNPAGHEAPRH